THTIVEIVVPDSPFLVDSVKMALTRLDLSSHLMLHNPTQISRSDSGRVVGVSNNDGVFQSLFHIEVDRLSSKPEMAALKTELLDIFTDTRLV
ncbi:hypothetical protein AB4501_29500, partial [Vibrio sp. 10N.222.55.E8]